MNAEQKLARIEELLGERARINEELLAILEPGPLEAEEELPQASGKPGKKQRKCGQCGKPGHIARHCPGIGTKTTTPAESSGQPLTEDEFDELKHLQKIGDLSSKDFSEDRSVSHAEVNKAIRARNFDEYERGVFLKNA